MRVLLCLIKPILGNLYGPGVIPSMSRYWGINVMFVTKKNKRTLVKKPETCFCFTTGKGAEKLITCMLGGLRVDLNPSKTKSIKF